jgi:NAD(P)-dependent dehydrogenase (short-subunit alcohol dehydrogenase family)
MRFKDKVVLVTGGNSGIGRGIAHEFAAEGARVAIAGRNVEKGLAVQKEMRDAGWHATFFQCDLTDEASAKNLVEAVSAWGALDVLINNAGLGARRADVNPSDPPGTRWRKFREPNLDASYLMAAYALPIMARGRGGSIVNISSTAAMHGNWGLYCVAKAGVEALTRALAVEAGPFSISVNCISPGWIGTEQDAVFDPSGTDQGDWVVPPSIFGRVGEVREIAKVAAFLASSDASFITGQTLVVDGGLSILDYPSMRYLDHIGQQLTTGGLPSVET